MKKTNLTALFLLTVLLATSCGGQSGVSETTPADTTTEAHVETSLLDSLGEKDFGGRKFTLLDSVDTPDLHVNIPGEEMNGDIVNDALFERDIAIESLYNVTIDYVQEVGYFDTFKNSVLADDDAYDLIVTRLLSNRLMSMATDGILANLLDADALSLDESWWSPLMYENIQLNGKMYYSTGDISPAVYQSPCCMFLNLDLMDDLGIDTDIYELVSSGKWTLDAVKTLTADLDRDVNSDDAMNLTDDFYGIVMQPTNETSDALIVGTGMQLCRVEGSELKVAVNEKLADTVERIRAFAKKQPYKAINDAINITFKSGRALMLQHKLESAGVHLRDMEDDYLILPMPKLDEAQETYISCISGYVHSFIGVPKTADLEFVGFVSEALARYSHEKIRPLAYDTIYEAKTVRDERTVEMLEIIFDTLALDFNTIYNFGGISSKLTGVIFDGKPLASELAAVTPEAEAKMADFVENW